MEARVGEVSSSPPTPSPSGRDGAVAVGALGAILAVTASWWALALWPMAPSAPEWLTRARLVCFGAAPDGLPHGGGWILLVGEPLGMLGALLIGWRGALVAGLRAVAARPIGRAAAVAVAALLIGGAGAAAARVAGALAPAVSSPAVSRVAISAAARLDRPAPSLRGLIDQHGDSASLDRWAGRPLLVTFAFAHCETVCPLLVRDVFAAAARARDLRPVVVVVTLDPWRDTPARLPYVADAWRAPADAYLLSGAVADVEAALDAWHVARRRDERTGEVAHTPVVYLLARDGRIAYASTGRADELLRLARRL